jgi:hypothetical protein
MFIYEMHGHLKTLLDQVSLASFDHAVSNITITSERCHIQESAHSSLLSLVKIYSRH